METYRGHLKALLNYFDTTPPAQWGEVKWFVDWEQRPGYGLYVLVGRIERVPMTSGSVSDSFRTTLEQVVGSPLEMFKSLSSLRPGVVLWAGGVSQVGCREIVDLVDVKPVEGGVGLYCSPTVMRALSEG